MGEPYFWLSPTFSEVTMLLNKRYLVLFIIFSFVLFSTLICFQRYIYVATAVNLGSTRGIHPYAEKIYIEDKAGLLDYLKALEESEPFVIWQVHSDPDLLGVYVNGPFSAFPIVSGEGFQVQDFFQNKKLVVVGKNLYLGTHLSLFEATYEIIAVAGHDFQTQYDSAIYYNLDSTSHGGFFYLDAENPHTVSKLLLDMSQKLEIVSFDDPKVGISEIIDKAGNYQLICTGYTMLLLAFVFLCNQAAFWALKGDMHVRKLLGMSHRRIILCAAAVLALFAVVCLILILTSLSFFKVFSMQYCVYELLPSGLLLTAILLITFIFSLFVRMRRMKIG